MRSTKLAPLIVAAGLVTFACSDTSEPLAPQLVVFPQVPTYPDPEFLPWDLLGPQLETMHASFTPVRGQKSTLEIRYIGQGGRFLRLEIDSETLRWRPDGTPIALGDSITIDVYVDPRRMMVTFHPPGLVFNPMQPAYLELRYDAASDAFMARESQIALWRQESLHEPWLQVESARVEAINQLRAAANLGGFTRYALAIGR